MAQSTGYDGGQVPPPSEAGQDPPNVRLLKFVVIGLGALLVACFFIVFGVIAWRVAHPRPASADYGDYSALVPAGARVTQVSLDGDRLALQVSGPDGEEILVVDVRRGRLVGKVRLSTGASASGN